MFEIVFVDGWDNGIPSYYVIHKDGKLFTPWNFKNEWEAIEEVKAFDKDQGRDLERLYSSIG